MRAVEIIMKKRGIKGKPVEPLTSEEIEFLITEYVKGEIPDYQIASWLMAVYLNGMTFEETAALTKVMLESGTVMDLSGIAEPLVDKHSTGGVGDKISLPLAPIVAANGISVPMMCGRALGHTGGTLDKLDSISGYKTSLSAPEFKKIISLCGFAMTGQTKDIVPADRLLYSLRDVTGTVESIPLITSSILSKKIAEGASSLVFDVKCGKGAFMKTFEDAELLADSLVKTAKQMGKKVSAIITNMDRPLGNTVGNFLEIEESIDILSGKGPKDTSELTVQLAARMILLGNKADTKEAAVQKAEAAISSGKAMELFLKNIELQGGNPKTVMAEYKKRRSKFSSEICAETSGFIENIDAFEIGMAAVTLGVGRNKTSDAVYADAGIEFFKRAGDKVEKGEPVLRIYGKNDESVLLSRHRIMNAITYSLTPKNTRTQTDSLILKIIE